MAFVYTISRNDTLWFYARTGDGGIVWTAKPEDAHDFKGRWEEEGGRWRHVCEAKEFAHAEGGRVSHGDPANLVKLHTAGPRVGQRVRIKEVRTDGYAYGEGVVISYNNLCFLSHEVELDNPPAAGAPDECGHCCTDPEILKYWNGPADRMEVIERRTVDEENVRTITQEGGVITSIIIERRDRGVAHLDGFDPKWWEEVSENVLCMQSCYLCVLGQRFETFNRGRGLLSMSYEEAVEHGFAAPFTEPLDMVVYYSGLTAAWKELIRKRRLKQGG
jgi:hypothetical protein